MTNGSAAGIFFSVACGPTCSRLILLILCTIKKISVHRNGYFNFLLLYGLFKIKFTVKFTWICILLENYELQLRIRSSHVSIRVI